MLKTRVIICVLLLLQGLLRSWPEQQLGARLEQQGLLADNLQMGARSAGQQQLLVVLGGLRHLLAAVISVQGIDAFAAKRWDELQLDFERVVQLVPNKEYYWDSSAWHLAYNAGAWELQNPSSSLSPQAKQLRRQQRIRSGRDFLRRGVEQMPQSWRLAQRLGLFYSDETQGADYAMAAKYLQMARERGAPQMVDYHYFYALARMPDHYAQAYALGREILQKQTRPQPMFLAVMFCLQEYLQIPQTQRAVLFKDSAQQYFCLSRFVLSSRGFRTDGAEEWLAGYRAQQPRQGK